MEMEEDFSAGGWNVRVPQAVRDEITRLARVERRRPTDLLRMILCDALEQRRTSNN